MRSKIVDVDKNKIIISIDDTDGLRYSFEYNPNVTYAWSKFGSKKLIHKKSGESVKYKDILVMKDDKNNIYFYPNTLEDLFSVHTMYKVSEWSFEDDVTIEQAKESQRVETISNKVDQLQNVVGKMAELLGHQYGDKGFAKMNQLITEIMEMIKDKDFGGKGKITTNQNTNQYTATNMGQAGYNQHITQEHMDHNMDNTYQTLGNQNIKVEKNW